VVEIVAGPNIERASRNGVSDPEVLVGRPIAEKRTQALMKSLAQLQEHARNLGGLTFALEIEPGISYLIGSLDSAMSVLQTCASYDIAIGPAGPNNLLECRCWPPKPS